MGAIVPPPGALVIGAPPRRDSGFAVLAVLLVLVALMGLAHGALVTAERELRTSRIEAALVARRMAARAAADVPPPRDSLPPPGAPLRALGSGSGGAVRWRSQAGRLDRETGLVAGIAWTDGIAVEDRVGVVIWSLDPVARLASALGVVETVGTSAVRVGGIRVDRWSAALVGVGTASCFAELRALDSVGVPIPAPVARVPPPTGSGSIGLGLLSLDSILRRAPVHPAGGPVQVGGEDGVVLLGSDDDLAVGGGKGRGVLAARGTIRLTGDASFEGVVLAGGDLVVEEAALLRGWARVGGDLRISGGGTVEGSACAAAIALREVSVLRGPVRVGGARIHPM